jgi:hypothetical protein
MRPCVQRKGEVLDFGLAKLTDAIFNRKSH